MTKELTRQTQRDTYSITAYRKDPGDERAHDDSDSENMMLGHPPGGPEGHRSPGFATRVDLHVHPLRRPREGGWTAPFRSGKPMCDVVEVSHARQRLARAIAAAC